MSADEIEDVPNPLPEGTGEETVDPLPAGQLHPVLPPAVVQQPNNAIPFFSMAQQKKDEKAVLIFLRLRSANIHSFDTY